MINTGTVRAQEYHGSIVVDTKGAAVVVTVNPEGSIKVQYEGFPTIWITAGTEYVVAEASDVETEIAYRND